MRKQLLFIFFALLLTTFCFGEDVKTSEESAAYASGLPERPTSGAGAPAYSRSLSDILNNNTQLQQLSEKQAEPAEESSTEEIKRPVSQSHDYLCTPAVVRGITLIPAKSELAYVPREAGIQILIEEGDLEGARPYLQEFIGCPIDQITVQNIKNRLIAYFTARCQCALVIIPEQEVTDRIILVEVLFSRVGNVVFDGQRCFPKCLFERSMNVHSGECLDQEKMLNNLAFLNRNPFHRTEMVLSPGEEEGTTHVEFHTQDQRPWKYYAGANNTGVKVTDTNRLFVGATWGNAFLHNDLLTYQYTTSPDFKQFQGHLLSYTHFLPGKEILQIISTYGKVNPEIPGFTTTGKTAQLSLRCQKLIKPLYTRFKSQCESGFDYKFLNNNLFFEGSTSQLPIVQQSVNLTEFQWGYGCSNYSRKAQITFKGEVFASLWKGMLPHQSTSDYQALRPGSHVRFGYAKGGLGYQYRPDFKWIFSGYLRGQIATCALLSSEQYILGGLDTVRGYQEAAFLADNAVNLNIEVFTPSFPILKKVKDSASFVFFWDFGYGYNYYMNGSDFQKTVLDGIGGGFRYQINSTLFVRADYGFQLKKIPGDSAFGMGYFSVVGSY